MRKHFNQIICKLLLVIHIVLITVFLTTYFYFDGYSNSENSELIFITYLFLFLLIILSLLIRFKKVSKYYMPIYLALALFDVSFIWLLNGSNLFG